MKHHIEIETLEMHIHTLHCCKKLDYVINLMLYVQCGIYSTYQISLWIHWGKSYIYLQIIYAIIVLHFVPFELDSYMYKKYNLCNNIRNQKQTKRKKLCTKIQR